MGSRVLGLRGSMDLGFRASTKALGPYNGIPERSPQSPNPNSPRSLRIGRGRSHDTDN